MCNLIYLKPVSVWTGVYTFLAVPNKNIKKLKLPAWCESDPDNPKNKKYLRFCVNFVFYVLFSWKFTQQLFQIWSFSLQ